MGTRMFDSSITDRLRKFDPAVVTAYIYINLDADDDGVCQSVTYATAGTVCKEEDIATLAKKGFIIRFPEDPDRVIVTHWNVNNNIPKSRKRKTANEDFLDLLELKGNVYRLKTGVVIPEPEPVQEPPKEEPKPEPEQVLVNEEKKRKGTPVQIAWKEFAEWTRRYPAIKQDDADGRAAMTQYMRMYQQSPDSYKKLIALLKQAVETEVKTGREGITLTEIVERVRGDTG